MLTFMVTPVKIGEVGVIFLLQRYLDVSRVNFAVLANIRIDDDAAASKRHQSQLQRRWSRVGSALRFR